LTFAETVGQIRDGDSCRSRMPADDPDNFGAERLHPMIRNWRWRPDPVIQIAEKQPFLS
jgi:hypothetical protein